MYIKMSHIGCNVIGCKMDCHDNLSVCLLHKCYTPECDGYLTNKEVMFHRIICQKCMRKRYYKQDISQIVLYTNDNHNNEEDDKYIYSIKSAFF